MNRDNSRRKSRLWLSVLATVLLLAAATGGLLARYMTTSSTLWQMISAGFHISSDTLKESAPNLTAACDPASGEFTVELYNYEVENIAAVSEVDTTYTVAVTNGTLDSVTDENDAAVTASGNAYTLPKGARRTAQTLHIIPDSNVSAVTVTVTATAPYTKTLSAVFTVSRGITVSTANRPEGGTVVTVHTNQYSGPLTLIWSGDKIPAAGVNEYPHGWRIGYNTVMTGGSYRSTAYRDNAQKECDYLFEFMEDGSISSWTVDNASGTVTLS